MRIAIVGSGPAGFYAAEQLLKPEEPQVEVDMIDRLPTPFGLVRGGVAPDHPKIKSVIRVYAKTAEREGFRFFGNVTVGVDVSADELAERYHAVVYSFGAETDRRLGIEGEDLPGSGPATAFVGWYNAHPDYAELDFDLSHERAVVIGNGNVAADVARMLALTRPELEETDTAAHAIDPLADSGVREIMVLGRRGPAQVAFTNPELRELGEMVDADIVIDSSGLELDPLSREHLDTEADITSRKNYEILSQLAAKETEGKSKRIVLRFLTSPVEIQGDGRVERIVVGRNELHRDETGTIRPRDTGERETIECGLVLRSIGYKGVALDGLPYDERRGVIPNERGRVIKDGDQLPAQYVAGWIKRGPTGVIGTNKKDAKDTVDAIFEDLEAGGVPDVAGATPEALPDLLADRGSEYVTYRGWEAIDGAEQARGEPLGRPRVKFVSIDEMLELARVPGAVGD